MFNEQCSSGEKTMDHDLLAVDRGLLTHSKGS
jgi:hypothetical protein